jgi:hypothetical protein
VLAERELTGDLAHDRALVYDALREGRCYIANDQVAEARGFAFWADAADTHGDADRAGDADRVGGAVWMGAERAFSPGITLQARTPQSAQIRLIRDGGPLAAADAAELAHTADEPGVYRIEASLGGRPWIYSNPIYLR